MSLEIQQAVNEIFDIYLEKARPRKRMLRDRRQQLRIHEKTMTPPVRKWMKLQRETILRGLPEMYGRKAGPMVDRLCDWKVLEKEAQIIMKPPLLEVLVAAGRRVVEDRVLKQEEFDPLSPLAVNWATDHAATLVGEVTLGTKTAIKTMIAEGIRAGTSLQKIKMQLRPIVGLNEKYAGAVSRFATELFTRPKYSDLTDTQRYNKIDRYARKLHRTRMETIARKETADALDAGTLQGFEMMGVEKVDRIEDPECCEYCQEVMDGGPYTLKETEQFDFHPNCLLGDSFISSCSDVTGISKRFYNGEIIILETASKRKLACTPNHPILGDMGFRPANSFDVGGYVISDGLSQGESFEYWKNINRPARIQDIAESFLKNRNVMWCEVPITSPHFHGDGIGSEVAIIGTNRFLVDSLDPPFKKHFLKLQFKIGKIRRILFDCFGMLAFSGPGYRSSTSRIMSGFDLMMSFILRHMIPKILDGFVLTSNGDTLKFQPPLDDRTTDVVLPSDIFLRLTRDIQADNIFSRQVKIAEPPLIIPNSFLDRITHIETSQYNGYVYNLETDKSYYIANGIASHNCEGVWVMA